MKITILAAVLLSIGTMAYADNNSSHHNNYGDTYTGPVDNSTTQQSASSSVAVSGSNSVAGSTSGAVSGSYSGGSSSYAGGSLSAAGGGGGGSATVNTHYRRQAPAATAPALTSGNDTCMGSSSVGGSGPAFGFSVGSTWSDEHCKMLKSAAVLYALGLEEAAIARVCMDKQNAQAMEAAGIPCPDWPEANRTSNEQPKSFQMVP